MGSSLRGRRRRGPRSRAALPVPSLPIPALPSIPLPSLRPGPSHSDEIHNDRMMRGDSVAMGTIDAASTFLPVFVARLGGSAFEVGLLTAIPAVFAVLLAIPVGQVLQRRQRIVEWYSRGRLLAHLSYVAMAVAVLTVPPDLAVPAVLAVWALAAVPSTIGIVAFPVVMDGAAGPRGRLELMGRRWAIVGVTSAVIVALVGLALDLLPFVAGYALVFTGFSIAGGIASCSRAATGSRGIPPTGRGPGRSGRASAGWARSSAPTPRSSSTAPGSSCTSPASG